MEDSPLPVGQALWLKHVAPPGVLKKGGDVAEPNDLRIHKRRRLPEQPELRHLTVDHWRTLFQQAGFTHSPAGIGPPESVHVELTPLTPSVENLGYLRTAGVNLFEAEGQNNALEFPIWNEASQSALPGSELLIEVRGLIPGSTYTAEIRLAVWGTCNIIVIGDQSSPGGANFTIPVNVPPMRAPAILSVPLLFPRVSDTQALFGVKLDPADTGCNFFYATVLYWRA